ncbi:hypothetical protein BDR26DRAFT_857664 [Obelidium mucronatum]|nr:hypothetical protein BDR26DRAFT_857664 [Obelidium mucronatum]
MSQAAPPPGTLTSTTPVNNPALLTKQIPSISNIIGGTCTGENNLVYTCGWDGVRTQEMIVQCQNGQIVYVNSCAAQPSLVNSGGACVYYDFGKNGNNANLYLPYCVNLIPVSFLNATSKPTSANVYVNGQIVIAPLAAGSPAGSASKTSAGVTTALGSLVTSVFATLFL